MMVSLWWEKVCIWSLQGWVTSAPQLASGLSVSTSVAEADSVLWAVREGVEAFMARPARITHG
jgi:hypothetical protein